MFLSRVQKRFIFKTNCDVSSNQNKVFKCHTEILLITLQVTKDSKKDISENSC